MIISAAFGDEYLFEGQDIKQYALRRCCARVFDYYLYSFVAIIPSTIIYFVLLSFFSSEEILHTFEKLGRYCDLIITGLFIFPISYSVFGTTAGKKLFGIIIKNNEGNNLGLKQAFKRESYVLFNALLIPIVGLIYGYKHLILHKACSWDNYLECTVLYKKLSTFQVTVRIFIMLCMVVSVIYIYQL
jgi:hypothetical protein